jgi:hypothetical protein
MCSMSSPVHRLIDKWSPSERGDRDNYYILAGGSGDMNVKPGKIAKASGANSPVLNDS